MDLRNRFIMAPIKLGYSDQGGTVNQKHIQFYRERSKYIGAITIEPLYLEKGLREIPTQLGIDNDQKIVGLTQLTKTIHAQGANVIAHLNHPGRMANPHLPGNYYISATDQPCENAGAIPRRMTAGDMEAVINLFVEGAQRAEKSGFDILELQFGHGYLLAQFLSLAVNDSSNKYGGSFENRCRFPLNIFKAVKAAVDLPIIIRVSGDEMMPAGINIDETIQLVNILADCGAAAVHVSAGTVCSTPPWFFQHMFVPKGKTWELAAQVKSNVAIPVIFVGRVNSISDVDRLEQEFQADYIAIGRALVADPDFIGKYEKRGTGRIRPCLACAEGCLGGVRSGQGLHCMVNPLVGYSDPPPKRVDPRNYAVIGGGLAGMQAALTLKTRGHAVDIYEKERLGGQFNLAWLPPNKDSLKNIITYFIAEIQASKINVIHKEAQESDLIDKGYDGIILATGAHPILPSIKGLKNYFKADFLLDKNLPEGKKILIIGGGLVGVEIASKLVDKNNVIIIVEMLDEVARGMEMIEKTLTIKKLNKENVPIYLNTKVETVDGCDVYLRGEKEFVLNNIDHIVVATGMQSYRPLFKKLGNKIPVYLIGDAKKVSKAQEAIRDGYTIAREL
ncbi:MAG: FAD-dependent oxidoreductase [Candidatus Marinimicrobia bacterium]|nr:FAD-dependent oxidoreductase [Candidatus Neomarinimicrobiota bacterium]